ncbi:abscission/NoCut checkpoint regulator [Ochlerotatus camptorhynchus]|uniref:abscission/NoCut checkpoint regulator n=1 Tax=Ochlerotatus camptorhynchus TaxID=644619 RepID=UPI0031E00CD6
MACNGCTKAFGLFLRENGCPSCKYSFCSKCLKFRMKIDGKNKDVCLRCYEFSKSRNDPNTNKGSKKLSSDTSILDVPVESSQIIVDIIRPVTVPEHTTDDDAMIRERLAALKQKDDSNQQVPEASTSAGTSLIDIEKRLAALKGVEYKDYAEANKKILLQKDNRSEEEQIKDLMTQFAQEQDIHDSMGNYRLAAIDDIEKRLAALKGGSTDDKAKMEGNQQLPDSDEESEETEDEAAKKLAVRFLEEAAIDCKKNSQEDEDELNNLDIPTPLDPSETEELPWCTICNEDAIIRCVSCGGDLFCRGCFKECHDDDEDYRKHETKPFKPITKGGS